MKNRTLLLNASETYWEHTSDMAFIKDLDGVYLCATKTFAAMTDAKTVDKIVGRRDSDIFLDPELVKRYIDDDARLIASDSPQENYVEPITSADGRPRYSLTSKYILRNEAGKAAGIYGVGRDVTLEYTARQSYENELQNLFELPPDALVAVLFDITAWRVVDVRYRDSDNRVVSRYRTIEDFAKNAAAGVVEDETVRAFFERFTQASITEQHRDGKRLPSLEYLRCMRDGTKLWVRDEMRFLLDPVNGHLSLCVVLHDVDEQKRMYAGLIEAAERDAMTGLFNRDATIRQIERHINNASGQQALFMIDLDNFKQINDSFGHQYGDRILTQVAEAIQGVFRSSDIVGRLGGDEFMVLMKDAQSEQLVRRKAESVLTALQFSASNGEMTLALTTSVGVLLFLAENGEFKTLYSDVDAALYQSKGDGKNRYTLIHSDNTGRRAKKPDNGESGLESVSTVQLRTLLDNMDGGVVLAEITDDIRITYVSPSLFRSFHRGEKEEADFRNNLFSFILPEDLPAFREAIFQQAKTDELREYDFRVTSQNGIEWRRMRAKRIPETGDGIHRLVAVMTDISDQQRVNASLTAAEARYRLALTLTDAMLWEVDVKTRMLTLIGHAWGQFHYSGDHFPNAPESLLHTGMIHPDSVERFRTMFADMFRGDDSGSYYIQSIGKGGEHLWLHCQFKLLHNGEGAVYSALGIAQYVPNINAEMNSFTYEMRFGSIVKDSLLGYFRANFTNDTLEFIDMHGDLRFDGMSGMSYDEYHDAFSAGFVQADDIAQYALLTAREHLTARFNEGEAWKMIDFRRILENGTYRWTCIFIKLMRHPISGDIYAFGYLRDNEVRRGWEIALNRELPRNTTLMLYSRESMEALAKHVLATVPKQSLVVCIIAEIIGLEKARNTIGEMGVRELLFTFGRMCRIVIGGDVIMGQMEENRIVLLRANIRSKEAERARIADTVALIKDMLNRAQPAANISFISGFAVERAADVTYGQLFRKADIACRSAAQTLGDASVAYADMGTEFAGSENESDLLNKYRALELRYQQQANMLRMSENDELTGIPGKRAFYRHVRETLDAKPAEKLAIIRFDINRFKVYNDVRGTAKGDRLLCGIAGWMQESDDLAPMCARIESDHFVALVQDDTTAINRAKDHLSRWLAEYDPEFRLTASFGVFCIDDPDIDVSLMCDRALLALKSIKSGFETKIAYYNNTLRYRMIDEQQMVGDMEAALLNEQFVIFFQPQVNYETGKLIGAEALVRWNHPKRGLLPPSVFIPLFERNGLITSLDEYVWDRCCQYVKKWLDEYPQSRDMSLSVSVNVSRLDIYDTKLCEMLQNLVAKYELPASSLRLEITESAYMENPQQLIDTVRELQSHGFIVEMDDFGSGYSSLNTLKDVAVDVLKLDMKFLQECVDSVRGGNILSSVIRMAHWLKLPIIAEGVESKAQADYLRSLGCVYMQGYYFAHPMPAISFEKLIVNGAEAFNERYKKTNIEGVAAFWDPSEQIALLFNSFVGGAAITEYRNGTLEIMRVNDNYYRTLGTTLEKYMPVQIDLLARFDEINRRKLLATVQDAIETGEECACELESIGKLGGVTNTWIHNRIRLLARNNERAILYIAIENITERKRLEREKEAEAERDRLLMQSTGLAFFDYDLFNDTANYRIFLPEQGLVQYMQEQFYDHVASCKRLAPESVEIMRGVIEGLTEKSSSGECEFRANLWDTGMRWCRMRYVGVDEGGQVSRWVGQIDDIQDIKDRSMLSNAIQTRLKTSTAAYIFNESVVEQIGNLFYESNDVREAIETTLAFLGEYYDLSRAYIFEDMDDHAVMCNTFEWCAPGVDPQKDMLQAVRYDEIGGWESFTANFDVGGIYYCPDVAALMPEQRAVLEPQGICSMLQYAIRDSGEYRGLVGFDECRENRCWTEEQVGTLRFVARIIATYYLKQRLVDGFASEKPEKT